MNYQVEAKRDMRGDLKVTTVVALDGTTVIEKGDGETGVRHLEITTSKHSRCVTTTASVLLHTSQGFKRHVFGLYPPGAGDFRKTLGSSNIRATEKAMTAMHREQIDLIGFENLLNEARAHYAAQAAQADSAIA